MSGVALTGPLKRGESGTADFSFNTVASDLKVAFVVVADDTARNAFPERSRLSFMTCRVIASAAAGGGTAEYRLGADTTIGGQVWSDITVAGYQLTSEKNVASGYAGLNADGKILPEHMENIFITDKYVVADATARKSGTPITTTGNVVIQEDDGSIWLKLNATNPSTDPDWAAVTSPTAVSSVTQGTSTNETGAIDITMAKILTGTQNATDFESQVAGGATIAGINSSLSSLDTRVTANENDKANTSDVLEKTNTTSFTPTANYHPATKKYADDAIATAIATLPVSGITGALGATQVAYGTGVSTLASDANMVWDAITGLSLGKALTISVNNRLNLGTKFLGETTSAGSTILSMAEQSSSTTSVILGNSGGDFGYFELLTGGVSKIRLRSAFGASYIANGDPIGLNTVTPSSKEDVTIGGILGLKIPVGTTAQRPVAPNTSIIRFNSTLAIFEGYNGTGWDDLSGSGATSWALTGTSVLTGGLTTIEGTPAWAQTLFFNELGSLSMVSGTSASTHGIISLNDKTTLAAFNSTTSGIIEALKVQRTGGVLITGAGVKQTISMWDDTASRTAGEFSWIWNDAITASRRSRFVASIIGASESLVEAFRADENGISADSGVQSIKTVAIPLSQAQIKTLNSVPVTATITPASGKYIQVLGVSSLFDDNATDYTTVGVVYVKYASGGIAGTDEKYSMDAVDFSGGDTIDVWSHNAGLAIIADKLEIQSTGDDSANGGTMKVYIQYVEIDTN